MGIVSDEVLQAEVERRYNSLLDQPPHTDDQILVIKRVIELCVATFKYYDFERTCALVGKNYKQHSALARSSGQESIIEVAGLLKSWAAKDWTGTGEPHIHIEFKRILVNGPYIFCQLHSRNSDSHLGQHVFDLYRYEDGRFVEHWDVVNEVPPASDLKHGNGLF